MWPSLKNCRIIREIKTSRVQGSNRLEHQIHLWPLSFSLFRSLWCGNIPQQISTWHFNLRTFPLRHLCAKYFLICPIETVSAVFASRAGRATPYSRGKNVICGVELMAFGAWESNKRTEEEWLWSSQDAEDGEISLGRLEGGGGVRVKRPTAGPCDR